MSDLESRIHSSRYMLAVGPMNRTRWHFLAGALTGTLLGLLIWSQFFSTSETGWLCVPFTAAACSFIAAYFQEDFYKYLARLFSGS